MRIPRLRRDIVKYHFSWYLERKLPLLLLLTLDELNVLLLALYQCVRVTRIWQVLLRLQVSRMSIFEFFNNVKKVKNSSHPSANKRYLMMG